ncbi:hypothetical protein V491_07691 [Pseudogymnoascus sp. VKM F-3775]|nr:hypothetical protein V491_07691 [Pseudogymnoascus sp. VKM F-3775]
MTWSALVLPTKRSIPSSHLQNHYISTPTRSSTNQSPLKFSPPPTHATGTRGKSYKPATAATTTRTCAGRTSASTTTISTVSYGRVFATGCQRVRATVTSAGASPNGIRGGGRELANVSAYLVGRQTTIGRIRSTEASTGISGNSTTPRRTWRRRYDASASRGRINRRMD